MVEFNKDLDFIEFSTNIIKEVDSIRSSGKSGEIQESRINAFYRAIGLPAIITDKKVELLKKNTGNLFDKITDKGIEDQLKNRENLFKENSTLRQSENNTIPEKLFDFNTSSIKDSIDGNGIRAKLFPMFVNANVGIFPQNRRIAGAFMSDEQLREDKIKYSRPLIETIVTLRVNELGAFNKETQSKIKDYTQDEYKQVAIDIQAGIALSLSNIIVDMPYINERIGNIRKKTSAQVVPETTPNQNPKIVENSKNSAELERQQKEQQQYMAIKEARLSLFSFEDTSGQTLSHTRNLKDAALASNLLNVIFSDSGQISMSAKETNKQKEKAVVELKKVFRDMDSILGTFSGLSGTDALVTIFALFKLDMDSLVKLLNRDARIRLKNQIGIDYVENSDDSEDVLIAIDSLQVIVRKIIEELAEEIKQPKHRNKKINK